MVANELSARVIDGKISDHCVLSTVTGNHPNWTPKKYASIGPKIMEGMDTLMIAIIMDK